ncbi:MAG: PAS domain S-box protein, partial [Halobaculum sp.]
MTESIRVLHVDDDPAFADLTATLLGRADDRVEVETESSAADGLARLGEEIDCVVSDYDMPGRDGIEFLDAVREEYPELPFVLFTGKGSEEVASEAISAGATDYLQKGTGTGTDQYELLANRVVNAVEQYRAQQRAEEAARRYSAVFENAGDAIAWVEFDDGVPVVRDANPAFRETFGGSDTDVIGRSIDRVVASDQRRTEAESLSRRVRAGEQLSGEVTRDTSDGDREFLWRAAPIADDDTGQVDAGFAIYTDITERKRREQQLEALQRRTQSLFETDSVTETARVAVETADEMLDAELSGVHLLSDDEETLEAVAVTDSVRETLGGAPDYPRDSDNPTVQPVWEAFQRGETITIEDTEEWPELADATVARSAVIQPLDDEGVFVVSATEPAAFDETDERLTDVLATSLTTAIQQVRREATLRQRESELAAERDRFRVLFENLTQPTVEVTYHGDVPVVDAVNEAFERQFGYDSEQICGESLDEFVVPDDPDLAAEAAGINQRAMDGESFAAVPVTRQTADGTRQYLLQNAVYDDGSGGFATYVDVTERADYREKLAALNEFAADLADAASADAVYDRTVEAAVEILEFDWCMVAEPTDGQFEVASASEGTPAAIRQERLDIESGVAGHALATGESRVTDDTHDAEEATPVSESIRSGVTVPVGERAVFQAISAERDAFDESDRELAELLIAHAQNALDRRDREHELERQNDRLDEFASVVSHDLRSPLGVARGQLELATHDCESSHLQEALDALDRCESLVGDILALAREGESVTDPTTVSLADVVEDCWEWVDPAPDAHPRAGGPRSTKSREE